MVSAPPFLDTATEDLLLELSEMGKVVAAVARPRRTAGKLKKEPKSKLNKLGLAKAMECICKRTKRRRQTLKKCVNILYIILCKLTVFENHQNRHIYNFFILLLVFVLLKELSDNTF